MAAALTLQVLEVVDQAKGELPPVPDGDGPPLPGTVHEAKLPPIPDGDGLPLPGTAYEIHAHLCYVRCINELINGSYISHRCGCMA